MNAAMTNAASLANGVVNNGAVLLANLISGVADGGTGEVVQVKTGDGSIDARVQHRRLDCSVEVGDGPPNLLFADELDQVELVKHPYVVAELGELDFEGFRDFSR